ncbi:MAG: PaaI family thioesterase [Hyphomonadaceae bacterium]|nr:PaaI family thioesterase [Hyphomonadaceae bacterium]
MTVDEINAFLAEGFPGREGRAHVEHADGVTARCRVRYHETQLRPGGTLSGPTMMALADTVVYALIFSSVGFSPLSVTTNLSINFLRKPKPADLIAEARLLKRGKALFVADVLIRSDGETSPVAHAVVTYSIPPKGAA